MVPNHKEYGQPVVTDKLHASPGLHRGAAAGSVASPGAVSVLRSIWQGFRQEHVAFIVVCVYLIFEYNRPQQVYPALDIIPWGKTLLISGLLLAFTDRSSTRPPAAAMVPMTAFSLCVLISMVTAFSPATAYRQWVDYFGWLFVVLLITSVVNSRKRLFLFMAVYFLANLKMAQHGFRSWAMGGFGFSSWGVSGSPGWFQNSGEFSMEMVVFLPLVLSYTATFRHEWSRGVKLLFYLLAIMVIGSIVAASNRGGVIGLMMIGCWCLAYSKHRIKALMVILLASTFIFLVMPTDFKARFETVGEDSTSLSRLAYWEYGLEAIRQYPATGIGFRNWPVWVAANYPEVIIKVGESDHVEVIHNTYLEAGTELGLIGGAVYLLLLLHIFISNNRTAHLARVLNDRFLLATATGLNGSLMGFLVPSYFMAVLYYPYIWILLSFTVSASIICRQQVTVPLDGNISLC